MQQKKRLDIDYLTELNKLHENIVILGHRLQAIGIDYDNYISPNIVDSFQSRRIHELCKNLNIRLSCVFFHTELFCNLYKSVEVQLRQPNQDYHSFAMLSSMQLHYLFDSIIYHISSVYDYLASLINFIHNYSSNNYVKWNTVGKSTKRKESTYLLATKIHIEYVDGFFGFRSSLIHEKANLTLLPHLSKNCFTQEVEIFIPSSHFLLKYFKQLSALSKDSDISLRYSMFNITNQLVSHCNDILFEMKYYMEENKKISNLRIVIDEEESMISASKLYWHENLTKK